jgi:CHAT domain-containing protein
MREIAAMRLDHAEFAYLSSCESGLGGTTLTDEAPHLAGALGMAGFRHVVATSWALRDDSATYVTEEVYRRLTEGGTFDPDGSGRALHNTLREIRNEYPLLVAAAYSHTGP